MGGSESPSNSPSPDSVQSMHNLSVVRSVLACAFGLCLVTANLAAADFDLKAGDRVVLLGDGLIEQEQYFGWIEVMMSTAHPDRNVTFRNLGWSGDTPAGASRFGLSLLQAGNEPDDEGWTQLQKQLELTKPTVLVLGYGMASAIDYGSDGLERFTQDYQRLLSTAREISPEVRCIFLGPISTINGDDRLQATLQLYASRIAELAKRNDAPMVDLLTVALKPLQRKDPIHLNSDGYRAVATAMAETLRLPASEWQESAQTETLRQAVLRKNEWWFHRSRPANMAYVFGFRKHEQGQNAVEIPQYDDLIITEELRIAELRDLQPRQQPAVEPRLESRYAEFAEQETPEFSLPSDWEVTLWAQNPQLNKPIHMNFDPQGRLWVASSEAYPMIEVGQAAPDKIVVLEDTTGDGKADTSTVFADGLLIPTGIAPGDGGVYVAQSTDLLFLQDIDNDGVADVKRRVLSGFGTEDTHHNLHTLRWGPDGRLYMNQSVYTRTDAETPHGIVRLKAGGGFRYDTKSMRMEIFFRGLWNSWGHQFDAFGQSFLSDGAGFAGIAYAFPGATFRPTPKARHILDLISPGNWPKFASMEIIQGDSFPPDWQGSIITCDFRANRVTRFSLREQDAGFVTQQEADLLRTSAPTFRPIDVKQGPDGALYIADWSNPIINHGEVDFRDARRDRWHGRIWRLKWKGARSTKTGDLTGDSIAELLVALNSSDRYVRDQAQRVLIERGEETKLAVADWTVTQADASGKLQALWLHQALDMPAIELLNELLQADNADVRAAAVRVLAGWADPLAQPRPFVEPSQAVESFGLRVRDEHPRVRLEAVRGLARLGSAEAALTAIEVLNQPMDRFLEHALALTVGELSEPLMEAIESGVWVADAENKEKQLEFVLAALPPQLASSYLTSRLATHPLSKAGQGPWIELIGKAGGPAELQLLLDQVIAGGFDAGATTRALSSLADAQRFRKMRPARDLGKIGSLLTAVDSATQEAAIKLAGAWRLGGQVERLAAIAGDESGSSMVRTEAVNALRSIGGKASVAALRQLCLPPTPHAIRSQSVVALAGIDADAATDTVFAVLEAASSEAEKLDLWRKLLGVKGFGKLLAGKLGQQELSVELVNSGMKALRDGGRNEPELLAVLTPMAAADTFEYTPDYAARLVAMAAMGDPDRGEAIYRRSQLACITCHAIGGVGGQVGPDMTSLGASAPVDYIVESLFDPNAKIKEGFHSVIVATEDDQIITGVEISGSAQELVIRDANNKLVRIPTSEVIGKRMGPSLMPTGVIDRLPQQEQVDLISFLSQLGKPGKFDASQGGVARLFEIFAGTHRIEQQGTDQIIQGEISDGWKPLLAKVNGDVPKDVLVEMTKQPINISLVHIYARTKIEVVEERMAKFVAPNNSAVWIDGKAVEGSEGSFSCKLAVGKHQVLVRLDARDLPSNFRLESNDVSFVAE